jgi:iron complex transport system substrate-binding protein
VRRLAAVLGVLALVACAGAAAAGRPQATKPKPAVEAAPHLPATVKDKDGRSVTVRSVERIVPLNGDIAEIVFALGLGDRVVGVDTSALYPPRRVASLPKIGYQRTLSAEGILSLRPTVVIGTASAGPPNVIEQIRGAGVPVVIVPEIEELTAGPTKLRLVGQALGVPRRGAKLAAQVAGQIALAKKEAGRATSRPRVAFLYVRGGPVQLIGGTETRSHSMIVAAGGIDAGAEAGIKGYQPITAEALVTARPDVLLLLSAGLDSIGGVNGVLELPGVAQTPAGRNRRVLAYDDLLLLGLGPRTGAALRSLVRGLHPELR